MLDKSFKRADLSIMHQSWSSFFKLRRGVEEKMDDYVDRFERKMAKSNRYGIVLPNKVLAMELIDAAKLSEKEIQIVLTGVLGCPCMYKDFFWIGWDLIGKPKDIF